MIICTCMLMIASNSIYGPNIGHNGSSNVQRPKGQ